MNQEGRLSWWLGFILAIWITYSSDLSAQVNPAYPNIIYVLVDDLGYGDVNLELDGLDRFNNPHIKTPNLAKLAGESLVFTQHYSASPVCSPSRAGLMTGRTPTRCNIGLYINDTRDNEKYFLAGQELTLAEVLRGRGYRTAVYGKWHLNGADWEDPASWNGWTGSFPGQQGFDYGIISKENPHFTRQLKVNTQKHPGDFFSIDGVPLGPIKGYTSDIIADWAIEWMDKQEAGHPFFLFLSFDAVHIRVSAADKYEALYQTGDARKDAYYANITHLDAAIGRVMDALAELEISDKTLLFFSSDNGPDILGNWDATDFCYGTSYPLMGQKYQLHEGGIRVLGMASWPGSIRPGISHDPNSTLDVLPTLAELTGTRLPQGLTLDGESILPHLLHREPIARAQPLYWQFDLHRAYANMEGAGYQRHILGPDRSDESLIPRVKIRDGDYTLYGLSQAAFTQPTDFQLYHVTDDPTEQIDVSRDFPWLYKDLKEKLIARYQSVEKDRVSTALWIEKNQGK